MMGLTKSYSSVYRPHRRAVVQSLDAKFEKMHAFIFPRVYLQARLGCPEARAYVRRRRRLHNREQRGEFGWYLGHKGHKQDNDLADLPERYLGTGVIDGVVVPHEQARYRAGVPMWVRL